MTKNKIQLKGTKLRKRKKGYAEWQLLEMESKGKPR